MITAIPTLSLQLKAAMVAMTNISIMNSSMIEHVIPEELTVTSPNRTVYKSHGKGNLGSNKMHTH